MTIMTGSAAHFPFSFVQYELLAKEHLPVFESQFQLPKYSSCEFTSVSVHRSDTSEIFLVHVEPSWLLIYLLVKILGWIWMRFD